MAFASPARLGATFWGRGGYVVGIVRCFVDAVAHDASSLAQPCFRLRPKGPIGIRGPSLELKDQLVLEVGAAPWPALWGAVAVAAGVFL